MDRAKRGGEIGMNGEQYKGGQFLPNTTLPKGANSSETKKVTGKQEVAPYLWQVSPNGEKSIWSTIGLIVKFVGKTSYSKETGKVGTVELAINPQAMGWTEEGTSQVLDLINRWNKGERWA